MANLYWTANGASPTTAPLVKVATGTSTMTMLQIANSGVRPLKVVEWSCSFDGSAAAEPVQCELLETGTVGASSMNAGFAQTCDDPNAPVSTVSGVTFWKSGQSEGSITGVRYGDLKLLPPNAPYLKQWPLGREFQVPVSHYLRIRFTAPATVNAYCDITWEE